MKKLMISIIHFYQKYISPYKGGCYCKYYPTCSAYGAEAIERYGAFTGGILALKRFLKCNPFSKGGFDPVPLELKKNYKFKIRKILR